MGAPTTTPSVEPALAKWSRFGDCGAISDFNYLFEDYYNQVSQSHPIASIEVPSGGRLNGFVNLEQSSFDCSAISNLQTQVAPLLALMSCQVKILGLLKPLIDVIRELPNPSPNAVVEFLKAATALEPCFLSTSQAGILPFLRDLLCIQIRSLNCLLRKVQGLVALATSEPATTVSSSQWQSVRDAYASIVGIFDLGAGLFQSAGITSPNMPDLGTSTDLSSISQDQSAIAQLTEVLQLVVADLGGCP